MGSPSHPARAMGKSLLDFLSYGIPSSLPLTNLIVSKQLSAFSLNAVCGMPLRSPDDLPIYLFS